MWTPSSVGGPRTPINRPLRLGVPKQRPRYPISPRQDMMQLVEDQTTQELHHFPVVSAEPVPNDWEDPASDPLAEEPAPALTYQSNMNTSGPFNDVNQNIGRMPRQGCIIVFGAWEPKSLAWKYA